MSWDGVGEDLNDLPPPSGPPIPVAPPQGMTPPPYVPRAPADHVPPPYMPPTAPPPPYDPPSPALAPPTTAGPAGFGAPVLPPQSSPSPWGQPPPQPQQVFAPQPPAPPVFVDQSRETERVMAASQLRSELRGEGAASARARGKRQIDFDRPGNGFVRFAAFVVDLLVEFPLQVVWMRALEPFTDIAPRTYYRGTSPLSFPGTGLLGAAVAVWSVHLVYRIAMEATGGTVGKRLFGLRTIRYSDSTSLGFGRAALRETIGRMAAGLFCSFGYISMLWDPNSQGWHDKVAGSQVVHKVPDD